MCFSLLCVVLFVVCDVCDVVALNGEAVLCYNKQELYYELQYTRHLANVCECV